LLAVDLSADGRTLASGSNDGTARLWDIAAGRQLSLLKHRDIVDRRGLQSRRQIAGHRLLGSRRPSLGRRQGNGDPRPCAVHKEIVWDVAFAPDGRNARQQQLR